MTKIGFIISALSPQYEEQDLSSLQDKYRPVFEELLQRGLEGRLVDWYDREESVDWSQYSMLIPSPALEYTGAHSYQALLSWLARLETENKSVLQNPPEVIRWNTHKSYLLDLEQLGEFDIFRNEGIIFLVKCPRGKYLLQQMSPVGICAGIRIPQTGLIQVGRSREEIRREVESLARTNTEIVAKPAVGASGRGTCKLNTTTGCLESTIEALGVDTDVIIQVECLPDLV